MCWLTVNQKSIRAKRFFVIPAHNLIVVHTGDMARDKWPWIDGGKIGRLTMRSALQNSRNLATVSLLNGGIASDAPASLGRICALALELQIYKQCLQYYPF